jgi:3-oxoacyl-[acyl-carrier protein] reductase
MKNELKKENKKNEMENKIVVVTGGSQGIGMCMATEFAKLKSKVIISSRTKEDLDETAKKIKAAGGFCEPIAMDVSDYSQVKKIFDSIIKKYSRIDVLINCAGIYGPLGPLESNDIEKWAKTIQINLIGTVNCIQCVVPFMKKQGYGKIINMAGGSVGGAIKPNMSAYVTSKAGVIILTEALATELKEFNIQVNAISPGAVNTRFLDQVLKAGEIVGKDFLEKAKQQKAEGGTPPEKAAELAVYLASSKRDFVTGKSLSAVWDDYNNFDKIKDKLTQTSLYNLRRIDDNMFVEDKKKK